jgi:iron complex outermembrane receptor protein
MGIAICMGTAPPPLQDPPADPPKKQEPDVTDIDLDDLLKVQVTSPTMKEQTLTDVPAAVTVIRHDDLRRMGATTLADALRSVPGLQVARIDANSWAISGRGFNSTSANKLLVLIDGRSVYSPLQSGVFWDVQDVFLEDVDRIEVIRGPGGSLWGANAINGVINIITKRADETHGGVALGGAGTEERVFAGVRQGFKISEDVHARVYAKYFDRDDAADGIDDDEDAHDDWFMARAGFRADWKVGAGTSVRVSGDYYNGKVQERVSTFDLNNPVPQPFFERTDVRGGNVVVRWEREFDPASNLYVQLYYDHTFRHSPLFHDILHTVDLDLHHRLRFMEGQDLIWGLGYRRYQSDFDGDFIIQSDPAVHRDDIVSAFVHYEAVLIQDRLRLTAGSKFENNDYTGFEYQPSVRMAWNPEERHMAWIAVSRAVRTPSIIDVDLRANAVVIPGSPPTVIAILGTRDFESEELLAFEAGYRVRPTDILSLDLAFFYNLYDNLRSIESGAPFLENDPPPQHLVVPFLLENEIEATTWGAEASANLQAAAWWLIQANYSHLRMNLDPNDGSTDTTSEAAERQNPRHQAWIRSAMDLTAELALDVMARYVSGLRAFDVEGYVQADVRLAWQDPSRKFEAALVGQNLMRDSHPEFNAKASRSEIQRGAYLSLLWRF